MTSNFTIPPRRTRFLGRFKTLHRLTAILLLTAALPLAGPAAGDDPVDSGEVKLMIDALIEELRSRHDPEIQWEPRTYPEGNIAQPTGRTALVALAMLEAGVPAQSDKLAAALEWMADNPAQGTYAISVRLMVWCHLPEEYRPIARTELTRLINAFSLEAGGWDYIPTPRPGYVDQSLTQYALQGIADAHEIGLEIPPRLIDLTRSRFLAMQTPDGGWGYKKAQDPPRGSLTAAGLASLALCEKIKPSRGRVRQVVDRSIAGAIDWLDARFERDTNPGPRADDYYLFYWLHAIERAGRATGVRRFRNQDWFEACVTTIKERMVAGNAETGFWIKWEPSNYKMAFVLFILHRGLESVPFGLFDTTETLQIHDELGPAARTLSDTIEQGVGWTRVELADDMAAWQQIPILVVRGTGGADWLDDPESPVARRLLDYLRNGGLVVPEPTDRGRFSAELIDLVKQAHPTLTTRRIESKDPIRGTPTSWRGRADVLESPVRSWILSAPKLELGSGTREREIEDSANMLAAFCVSETAGLLPSRVRDPKAPEAPESRRIRITRIRHEGDWAPEPESLRRLADALRSTPVRITIDDPDTLEGEGIAWVNGATREDADRIDPEALRTGGARRILVESMNEAFTEAFSARLLADGWVIANAPPDTPAGSARITHPDGTTGLLITEVITRTIMGRPATDGSSMTEIARLLRITADLDPPTS